MSKLASSDKPVRKGRFISFPLFKQTFKSSWFLWLILTIGSAGIFFVINTVVFSKDIFVNIDMDQVTVYVKSEGLSWLQILGLMDKMGFNLQRIEVMSRIDLNSILNELVYKIAGVLLPMIYVMLTANSLIASQVSSGSLAYILSTPTSRRTVLRTHALYMFLSVLAMYVVITASAMGSETIAGLIRVHRGGSANMIPLRTFLYCLASFSAMIGLTGICFGASAFFNKSNNSIALGGGVCVLSFLGTILGLFGNKVFVSVGIGVEAMGVFNYASLFTLIDTEAISDHVKYVVGYPDGIQNYRWLIEIGILYVIGAIFALIGSIKFTKKDLPL